MGLGNFYNPKSLNYGCYIITLYSYVSINNKTTCQGKLVELNLYLTCNAFLLRSVI